MKKFKRILALVIATAMVLTMMSMTAFAADDDPVTYTIKITAPTGHTYEVYQVFTGTPEDGELTGLRYGQNAATGTEGDAVSQEDMAELERIQNTKYANDQAKIADLEKFVTLSNPIVPSITSGTVSAALKPGYYVIKDKDNSAPGTDGVTLYMFQVLDANLETSAKSDKPSSDKSVDTPQTNASDYNIGDTIPYFLTFTLPSDYANFKKYYVEFKDTMDAGLTYNADAKIFYGASDTTGAAIDMGPDTPTAGATLNFVIDDLKTGTEAQKALKAGDVITIKYTAYLNEAAVIGKTGNKNEYSVEFSRNPNESGTGKPDTGETPPDTTIVFSYKTIFDKIDQDGNKLTGADFKLEKKVDGEWVDVTTLNTSAKPAKIGSSAQNSTQFTFQGLDEGEYKLTETFTPSGYNTLDPIEFTITADVDGTLNTSAALRNLFSTGLVMTSDVAAGSLTTSIKNQTGVALPETGGIGTTIFYVVGAILVIGAGVVLITRRRMSA